MGVTIRLKNKKDNRQAIYLDIIQDNQRRTETLRGLFHYEKPTTAAEREWNKNVMQEAKKIANKKEEQLLSSTYDFIKEDRISFLDLFKIESDKHYARRGCKSNHYCCYKHLVKFTKGKSLMYSDLTEKFAEEFQEYLMKNLSNNCSRIYMKRFRRLILMAIGRGYIKVDITENLRPIKEEEQPREVLTAEEVNILKATPCKNAVVKNMFLFGVYTSLRISDLKALTWGNIRDNKIVFRPNKTKTKILRIPLNEAAKQYMGERGLDSDKIFKWPWGESNRYDLLREWIWLRAGITRNITWHCTRHTLATLLYEQTSDIRAVQKVLGHSRVTTTEIYARMVDEKLVSAMATLDNI